MTENSYICRLIANDPNWRETLQNKRINISYDRNFAIFNYSSKSDFSDPVVCEARGIIIDINKIRVVCWPFKKFFNHGEQYAEDIDWKSARVEEKIDGSIIKRWYDPYSETWKYSTNSVIDAVNAPVGKSDKTFFDCITETDDFAIIQTICRNKSLTYMFELVHPDVQNIIKYQEKRMYFTGLKDTHTGVEYMTRTVPFLVKPKIYPYMSLLECINEAHNMNKLGIYHEGFVVVDKDFNRIKVKSPEYIALHCAYCNGNIADRKIMEILLNNTVDIDEIKMIDTKMYDRTMYLYKKMQKVEQDVLLAGEEAKERFKQVNNNRKAFALMIKDSPYRSYMFRAIDGEEEIEKTLSLSDYERLMPVTD